MQHHLGKCLYLVGVFINKPGACSQLFAIILPLSSNKLSKTGASSQSYGTLIKVEKGKYQESIQSSTTPDPVYQWESGNFTIRHHKQEPRGSPFPAGDHKASINRHARKHKKLTEIT